MIVFPSSKINLGLQVLKKRADGFHDLETVFYPIRWSDALEAVIHEDHNKPFIFTQSGLPVQGSAEENLIYKAWTLLCTVRNIPPLKVHLHKNIPMGAGLGGGSSDAAHFIQLLDDLLQLKLLPKQKKSFASQLGSDCAFFLRNKPLLAKGKGNKFSKISLSLAEYFILVVCPPVHSNTKVAYAGLMLHGHDQDIKKIVEDLPVKEWRDGLENDFEDSVFSRYPQIAKLKESMYEAGALYASLSGSGSAVYGIFEEEPELSFPDAYQIYLQTPGANIL